MRDRSETIYADNENEYKEMMMVNDSRRQRNKNRKKYLDEDLQTEKLSCFQNYSLSIIEPTIEEKEKADEMNLLNAIDNLNRRKFKSRLEKNFTTDSDYENLFENFNSDLQILISNEALKLKHQDFSSNEQISKDSFNLKLSLSKNSTEDNTFSFENSQIEAIVSQNFIDFEHIFKLIVIGDKAVGKTLFVDRFVSDQCNIKHENKAYAATECLEIKKTFLKILEINCKLELWDTNISITNSPIINSKLYHILTYYLLLSSAYLKISNGFILIADYDRMDSFTFLEKHFENIHNVSNSQNEVLFIINKKCNSGAQAKEKENSMAESKIKLIRDTFNIKPIYLNLSNFSNDNQSISQFLSNLLMHKLADKKNHIHGHKINSKLLASKSPSKLKKISNSNLNSPKRIETSKCLNITQKRTKSVKKNLNDIFEKLKLESI